MKVDSREYKVIIDGKVLADVAPVTRRFLEELQRQVWARPEAIGKAEFIYRRA